MVKFIFRPFRNPNDCDGHVLLELLVSLAVGALLLVALTGMTATSVHMEEKLIVGDKVRQNGRRAYAYFQKQILSADKVIIENGQVYIKDMDPVSVYYNLYTLNDVGVIYRIKYKDTQGTLENIGIGQTSHLIDEVAKFDCRFVPPKGIAMQIEFKDGYLMENIFYIGGRVDER